MQPSASVSPMSRPPPPPPPPPPLPFHPILANHSYSSVSSPRATHQHHLVSASSSASHDLDHLVSTSTPIHTRKQQLFSQDSCSSPSSNRSNPSGNLQSPVQTTNLQSHNHSHNHQAPSKLLQNELRRSRHCVSSRMNLSENVSCSTSTETSCVVANSTNGCVGGGGGGGGGNGVVVVGGVSRQFRSSGKFAASGGVVSGASSNGSANGNGGQAITGNNNNHNNQHRCNKHRTNRTGVANGGGKCADHHQSSSHHRPSSQNSQSTPCAVTTTSGNNSAHMAQCGTTAFDGSKKSRCILFSQIYLIAHVSITLCLNEIREQPLLAESTNLNQSSNTRSPEISFKELILDVYLAYILVVALGFFFVLRCYVTPAQLSDSNFNELTEQSPVLFGATLLGLSELALTGLQVLHCLETEFIILPLLKFSFSLFLMHFLLTQIIHSDHIGLRNIAIAHLLGTQLSLWILSLSTDVYNHEKLCNYNFDVRRFRLIGNHTGQLNATRSHNISLNSVTTESISNLPSESFDLFKSVLHLLTHQFKLLTIFILVTMWFTNNQSKINFIRAKLSDEEVLRASNLNPDKKRYLLKGFAVGLLFLVLAFVTILFPENRVLWYCSMITLQVLIAVISTAGLVIRRRKKYLNPKYQINVLKHHFIIFFTLFAGYVMGFIRIVLLLQQLWSSPVQSTQFNTTIPVSSDQTLQQVLSILSWITLLVQITVQTYLLRLQGKKLVDMSHIFALLVTANLSLWIVDVAVELTDLGQLSQLTVLETSVVSLNFSPAAHRVLAMFVTLNRYYCALIFIHFWKMRI